MKKIPNKKTNIQILDSISIRGISTNNLKNIDIDLPKNKIISITGVSGSGKSSLAFGTIYKEGQFRYIESLSSYLRQFFNLGDKPNIESSSGLSPAIAIEQNKRIANSRSSVGTLTEIDDYLRLLFAKLGDIYCRNCGDRIQAHSVDSIIADIYHRYQEDKIYIISAMGDYDNIRDLGKWVKKNRNKMDKSEGYTRYMLMLNSDQMEHNQSSGMIEYFYLESPNIPEKYFPVRVYGIYDRITLDEENRSRLKEDIVRLLNEGNKFGVYSNINESNKNDDAGMSINKDVRDVDSNISRYTDKTFCPKCNITYPEFSTQHFSSNRQEGACNNCHGLGEMLDVDINQVLDTSSIVSQCIIPWRDSSYGQQIISKLCAKYNIEPHTPYLQLSSKFQDILLNGDHELIKIGSMGKYTSLYYRGVTDTLTQQYNKGILGVDFANIFTMKICKECNGAKLKKESLNVKIGF